MKKRLLAFILVSTLFTILTACNKNNTNGINAPANCFKGRVEIIGLCKNITIKLLEGNMSSDLLNSSWVNPSTGLIHQNVFRLDNICSFPATLKEGDEFYFQIKNSDTESCANCKALYPTPPKGASIQVLSGPCRANNIN
ncbi:hypothetical protein [Flavisolibacter tropicus]|uniref:Uncharacterized protein n=1 Tax=Flavisolibacter tropicus TaxID=1492898 RepID=A0A172TTE3_9BACT|nr:hypothetical protein [Flavisolibacter tropicus]ANE50266.1 hypothetical protein SY85_06890 [Flavisolibacter tropicus]